MQTSLLDRLKERRVPQFVGLYLGVAWGIIQFVDWLVKRYLFSNQLVEIVLVGFVALAPSVILLAYTHGAPGRDRWGMLEKISLPLNILIAVGLLVMIFQGEELGATTETVTVTDEEGQTSERVVAKASFRRQLLLYFWDEPSGDSDLHWLRYGLPSMLALELDQNLFIDPVTPYSGWENPYFARLRRAGIDNALNVPLSLGRQLAADFHLPFFVNGELQRGADSFRIRVRLYTSEPLEEVASLEVAGEDLLALVDRLAVELKGELGIPEGSESLVGDLPVAEHMSASLEALEAYIEGKNALLLANDRSAAIARFEDATRLDPAFARAYAELADAYAETGRSSQAFEALDLARKHDYKLTERERFLIRAMGYQLRGDSDKGISVLEMLADLYPADVTAQAHLANAYLLNNRVSEAIATYQRIYELDPSEDWTLRVLARLYEVDGRFEDAVAAYGRFAGLHPEDHMSYLNLGELYLRQGDHAAAREELETALLLTSGLVGPIVALARLDLMEGAVDLAEARLREAEDIAGMPSSRRLVLIGWLDLLRLTGQIEAAAEILPRLIEVESEYRARTNILGELLFMNAEVWVAAGRREEALAWLGELESELEPPFDLIVDLGYLSLHLHSGELDLAELRLEKLAGYFAESDRQLYYFVERARGRLHEARDEPELASAAYARALQQYFKSPSSTAGFEEPAAYFTSLGRAQRLAGDLRAAEKSLEEALRLFPSYPEAHLELAYLHRSFDRPESMREHLDGALEIWREADPDYPPARAARSFDAERPLG